jgi:sporulation and spore germination protein
MNPQPLRWLLPAVLLAGLTCCARSDSAQGLDAGTRTGKVKVFAIALNDHGAAGRAVGCGDSAVPVELDLPSPQPALEGALNALLSLDERPQTQGLYNALAHSPLKVERIDRSGPEARVYLTGYVELGGECDSPRILAQLTETALQFPDVQRAQFFLDGKPLRALLSGQG